ncbi:MAG: HD domain-containing phosphohydrolase [Gemmatimonadaceae bacterium]|nr:HD domain-containing phosphohydrolase [Gemmatimonadaceae bacterium]
MLRYAPFLVGAAAGALYARERRALNRVERLGAAALETLLDAIDANNAVTGAHVRRVADYALILADAADLDEREQNSIERVALFHDIGKIDGALSDIVDETTALTPKERKAVMTHPRRGAEVLAPLAGFYPDLPEGVLAHHERWDGNGYPRGLRGCRIPLAARVVAIADTFDAVTHARPYSRALSRSMGLEIIGAGRGKQFDPDLVDLFLSPPVVEAVEESMRKSHAPRKAGGKRRAGRRSGNAPDINFRWRSAGPARR